MQACVVDPLAWDATESLRETPTQVESAHPTIHNPQLHPGKPPISRHIPSMTSNPRAPRPTTTPTTRGPRLRHTVQAAVDCGLRATALAFVTGVLALALPPPTGFAAPSRLPGRCLAALPASSDRPRLRTAAQALAPRPPRPRPGRLPRPTRPVRHRRHHHVRRSAGRPRRSRRHQRPFPHDLRAGHPHHPPRRHRHPRHPTRHPLHRRHPLPTPPLPPLGPPQLDHLPQPPHPPELPPGPPAPPNANHRCPTRRQHTAPATHRRRQQTCRRRPGRGNHRTSTTNRPRRYAPQQPSGPQYEACVSGRRNRRRPHARRRIPHQAPLMSTTQHSSRDARRARLRTLARDSRAPCRSHAHLRGTHALLCRSHAHLRGTHAPLCRSHAHLRGRQLPWTRACQASSSRERRSTPAGSLPLARSVSVVCSSTSRRLARAAIQTRCNTTACSL